ncbi:GNAT family N-acetyltransferase [Colwellia sp. BRX8-8]|nr:GNAT family N-acetyltransferase [Colwellia sp. BRX8-8]
MAIDDFFTLLNDMHVKRWSKKCFAVHSLTFHKNISSHFNKLGFLRSLSLLEEGEAKAVCYDIEVEGVCYNIQLGFELGYDSKISMGTLMLGYAIESAFNKDSINEYDLLAGGGKKTFYKDRFKGNKKSLTTIVLPLSTNSKILFLIMTPIIFIKFKIKKFLKRKT